MIRPIVHVHVAYFIYEIHYINIGPNCTRFYTATIGDKN